MEVGRSVCWFGFAIVPYSFSRAAVDIPGGPGEIMKRRPHGSQHGILWYNSARVLFIFLGHLNIKKAFILHCVGERSAGFCPSEGSTLCYHM